MKDKGRYSIKSSSQGQYEPNSDDQVLKNLQGITMLHEIEQFEASKFSELIISCIDSLAEEKQFTESDICQLHYEWLKDLYVWAGVYRQVNMSKGGFTFAAAHLVPSLMKKFEQKLLFKYTPCIFPSKEQIIEALAVVHVELLLIHPFREGNGRIARLLASLMALQAGLPILDFSFIEKDNHREMYFSAVRAGMDKDYEPMKVIFDDVVSRLI